MQTVELLDHQYRFIHAKHKVTALICGVGAGKSFAGRIWCIKKALENPETLGFIGANTYSQLRDTVLTPLFETLDEMGIPHRFNAQTGELSIADAKIKCSSLENFNMLRGIEIGWCYLDEIRDLKQEAFMMMLGRLRDRKSQELELRATTTPNGFDWIYDLFAGEKTTEDFAFIHASTKDNPHLPESYLRTLTSNYDSQFAKQELEGQFVSLTAGRVYHAFDRDIHTGSYEPREGLYTLHVGVDFNVNPLTAVIAEMTANDIRVIDEIHLADSNTFQLAAELRKRYPKHTLVAYPDATGKARKTSAISSDHAILQDAGIHVKANKVNPLREDRFNTVNKAFQDGILKIDKGCKMLVKNLEQEVHGKNPSDIGHINDALGYLVYYYRPLAPARRRSSTIRFS